ncbi:assimilatory sulfite reductase (NADPH) flavoprotein subunit [Cognatishimia activa]|uniref:Sulfite reductase [NADPH] flavoprotein alpha-component n=1 Tax=Cognatishimia activa TaxID=1715691 RepID=A0A0P1IT23_9RHOB|nr:assimilatory sulfite reductase (NADPH) flavoprotein subunit [Cognatishimia activa]CUI74730.1 Sulfite reductase [NADPH] flavoprotein alpha-component [Cognatishimia activa]CUK26686.1 Sulfite reductase [NADPH] flavoprotein alpha-component [Cognatishimia activa]
MMLTQVPQGINPLSTEQAQQFAQLAGSLSPIQQAWISGYLAATAQSGVVATAPAAAPVAAAAPLTVLYGSQTGNAKHIAADYAEAAKARGMDVKLVDMADFKPAKLKDEKFLTIIVSTYGEGEPPEPAEKLHAFLASKKAPKLDGVQVAVLGIGDSSYEFFCQTAVDFEDRLSALGAKVVHERAMFDVDYDDHTEGWINGALDVFEPELKAAAPAPGGNVVPMPGVAAAASVSQYSKKNPFAAEVSVVQKITGRDSTKDVRHVEISLDGSDLTYQAGDALGVYFHNDAAEVDAILEVLGVDGAAEAKLGDVTKSLRDLLIEDLELTQAYPTFAEKYGNATGDEKLIKLAEDKVLLRDYLEPRQIFDILRDHPHQIEPQALVDSLRKMQPRLYSIASSQSEVEDEVHLTVGVVEWDAFERGHLGGASGHLGRRADEGDSLRVFVESNNNFRLPQNPDTPTIMVGPGTGIAPFRAFLQEREAQEAEGKNWLFFGNPHFTQDFLYQVELQGYLKSGLLSKLDVAFSRDQAEKVYVQDRILENGEELFKWLEDGAHFYICGDANRMAKDVHAALLEVLKTHGGLNEEKAEEYLANLKDQKRYQRDVY